MNSTVQNYIPKGFNFVPKCMEAPKRVMTSTMQQCWVSISVVLECGTVIQFDVVYLRDNTVAAAFEFWQSPDDSSIVAKVKCFHSVRSMDMDLWRLASLVDPRKIHDGSSADLSRQLW